MNSAARLINWANRAKGSFTDFEGTKIAMNSWKDVILQLWRR